MGKSLNRVHRDIQRESIKREILKHVERKSIPEIATGLKGCFLLALKKEGWGQQRAIGGPAGTRGPPGSPGWRAGTQGQSPGRPCMLRHGTGRGSIQQPSGSPGLLSYCLQFLFHTLLEWSFKIAVPM